MVHPPCHSVSLRLFLFPLHPPLYLFLSLFGCMFRVRLDLCLFCLSDSVASGGDKIPTIATQLKIIAAVKATRQGGDGEAIAPLPTSRSLHRIAYNKLVLVPTLVMK